MFCRPHKTPPSRFSSFLAQLMAMSVLLLSPALAADNAAPPVYFNLPEITTAINSRQQVVALVSLRLAGPKTEQRARDRMVRLRHAFVLQLADLDLEKLDALAMDNLAESYREEANQILSSSTTTTRRVVISVLLQKFVVQSK